MSRLKAKWLAGAVVPILVLTDLGAVASVRAATPAGAIVVAQSEELSPEELLLRRKKEREQQRRNAEGGGGEEAPARPKKQRPEDAGRPARNAEDGGAEEAPARPKKARPEDAGRPARNAEEGGAEEAPARPKKARPEDAGRPARNAEDGGAEEAPARPKKPRKESATPPGGDLNVGGPAEEAPARPKKLDPDGAGRPPRNTDGAPADEAPARPKKPRPDDAGRPTPGDEAPGDEVKPNRPGNRKPAPDDARPNPDDRAPGEETRPGKTPRPDDAGRPPRNGEEPDRPRPGRDAAPGDDQTPPDRRGTAADDQKRRQQLRDELRNGPRDGAVDGDARPPRDTREPGDAGPGNDNRRNDDPGDGGRRPDGDRDAGRPDRGPDEMGGIREERQRREVNGREVIVEPGGRTIIRNGDRTVIRYNELDRLEDFGDVRRERRGDLDVTIVERGNGVRIITYTDVDGHVVRRVRRTPDGREYVLFVNRPELREQYDVDPIIDLPPPVMTIPEDEYVVEAERASPRVIYDTFAAPPVMPMERRYSLEQVVNSPTILERVRRIDLDTITFDTGSWTVAESQIDALDTVATAIKELLAKNPNEVFLIEGHTDAVGSALDNLSLSDRRAEEVAYLLTKYYDVPPENLTTKGYGEAQLKVETDGPSRENRRVTMRRITPLLETSQADQQ